MGQSLRQTEPGQALPTVALGRGAAARRWRAALALAVLLQLAATCERPAGRS